MVKNYLIVGGIIVVSLAGIWLLAIRSDNKADQIQDQQAAVVPQEPERYDPSQTSSETTKYTSQYNPELSLSYPSDWQITPGADNSSQEQLVTFESPKDANGYYFCLDLTEVDATSDLDLETTAASLASVNPFTADGVDQALSSVLFTVEGSNLLWSVVDSQPQTSQTSFDNQITNSAGRRLQSLGRFNCRETDTPLVSQEQFESSRWFHDGQNIMHSLSY